MDIYERIAKLEKEQAIQADILARRLRIKQYHKSQALLVSYELRQEVSKPYLMLPKNPTCYDLLDLLANQSINGSVITTSYLFDRASSVFKKELSIKIGKVGTANNFNVKGINKELKFLKGIHTKLSGLLEEVIKSPHELVISFIDRDTTYKWLVYQLLNKLQLIIDEGYLFKDSCKDISAWALKTKVKRFENMCSGNSNTVPFERDKDGDLILFGIPKKPSGHYKSIGYKRSARIIRILKKMPIVTYDTNGKITRIDSYVKKELPLYLKD